MKKIYISGKVTGVAPEVRKEKFTAAEINLRNAGFDVINPIKLIENQEAVWEDVMKKCIRALMLCDAVLALRCSADSVGANIDIELAKKMDIPVFNDSVWEIKRYFKPYKIKRQ